MSSDSPTPPQGELEEQYNFADELQLSLTYEYAAPHNRHKSIGDEVDRLMRIHSSLITAQVQAAEARGRREALKSVNIFIDDKIGAYCRPLEQVHDFVTTQLVAALGDTHE